MSGYDKFEDRMLAIAAIIERGPFDAPADFFEFARDHLDPGAPYSEGLMWWAGYVKGFERGRDCS